jgi:hypothetical protein
MASLRSLTRLRRLVCLEGVAAEPVGIYPGGMWRLRVKLGGQASLGNSVSIGHGDDVRKPGMITAMALHAAALGECQEA